MFRRVYTFQTDRAITGVRCYARATEFRARRYCGRSSGFFFFFFRRRDGRRSARARRLFRRRLFRRGRRSTRVRREKEREKIITGKTRSTVYDNLKSCIVVYSIRIARHRRRRRRFLPGVARDIVSAALAL